MCPGRQAKVRHQFPRHVRLQGIEVGTATGFTQKIVRSVCDDPQQPATKGTAAEIANIPKGFDKTFLCDILRQIGIAK
jgi:hypothetical protein